MIRMMKIMKLKIRKKMIMKKNLQIKWKLIKMMKMLHLMKNQSQLVRLLVLLRKIGDSKFN